MTVAGPRIIAEIQASYIAIVQRVFQSISRQLKKQRIIIRICSLMHLWNSDMLI